MDSRKVLARRKVVLVVESGADVETPKKRAAKARQEAIMAQMKAQQASFAINLEDVDDDEDEEMEHTRGLGTPNPSLRIEHRDAMYDAHHNYLNA